MMKVFETQNLLSSFILDCFYFCISHKKNKDIELYCRDKYSHVSADTVAKRANATKTINLFILP